MGVAATQKFRFGLLQGVLPINSSQMSREIIAGLTLAALGIPEVMGYTKIIGTPVITGLYTLFLPVLLFAAFLVRHDTSWLVPIQRPQQWLPQH